VLDAVPVPAPESRVLKVEGLTLRGARDGEVHLLAVVDEDDPDRPSVELELSVRLQ
jgi:hypothetical protein